MPHPLEEQIAQLRAAMVALEAQRPVLGDAVVDTMLAPARNQLVELQAQVAAAEQKRKQITVLFADVSSFTAMSEMLDAEDVTEIMNGLWARLDAVITGHGGKIDKHIGDAIMALWGVEQAREDDPERAIRAALAMQVELASFRDEHQKQWAMRIGLNTGPVLLGVVGSTHEFTAMGDTVNLASRLEHAAPVGGILISHDTYRHVRGVFDVLPQAPLTVKGKAEPVQTYVVQGARPRTFRVGTRGVEGIETRMVGREAELERLQDAYLMALRGSELQMATIVAGAGVGKSRLLYEFQNWCDLRPEWIRVFKGRASQGMQSVPHALLRDAFSFRFQIQDNDSLAVVQEKMERAVGWALGQSEDASISPEAQMRAHFIGHLLGFDFSGSPYLKGILQDTRQIRDRALAYLSDLFKVMLTHDAVAILLLEDIHWADDSSLDALTHLAKTCANQRMLIVCAARPELLERHPQWGEGQAFHTHINLEPLSRRDSRTLVNNILQKVQAIPDALREMIVSNAEGNPFYVEELIKMLIEDGVIVRGEERWQVNPARLVEARVPPTLTAVLQARFDTLPAVEKAVLQRASVVGRTFWAEAVDYLAARPSPADTLAALEELSRREMVFRREGSTFTSTSEYIFKHVLLRDAIYESVLKHERRAHHARAAEWLIATSATRAGEFAGLIAEHLEQAGQAVQAAGYLRQAGKKALATSALREAFRALQQALSLLPPKHEERAEVLVQIGEALEGLDDYVEACRYLEEGLRLAQESGECGTCAAALAHMGSIAISQGDWPLARAHLEKGLALAHKIDDRARLAYLLRELGWVDIRQGIHAEARVHFSDSLAIYQSLDDKQGMAHALNGLASEMGLAAAETPGVAGYDVCRVLFLESLALCREVGDRWGEAAALGNLGTIARWQRNYAAAVQYYQESLPLFKETGNQSDIATMTGNLGHAAYAQGDYATARTCYFEALQTEMNIGAIPMALESLVGLAGVLVRTGKPEQALDLLGVAAHHPALMNETRQEFVEPILADLCTQLAPEVVMVGLERGQALRLEEVVQEMAAEFERGY